MNDSKPFQIQVRREIDIEKLVAFLRAGAKNVQFLVDRPMVDRVLAWLEDYARRNPGKLVLELVRPDGERIVLYAAGGAVAGGVAGFVLGGGVGAIAGALLGAAGGVAAAHANVRFEMSRNGDSAVLQLA